VDVVAYTRVSTRKQRLDVQREEIERFCRYKNLNIYRWYEDKGVSGVLHRPNWERCLNTAINNDNIAGVVVYDLTRAGRSTSELLTNIQRLRNANKMFISVKENIDTTTKEGRLLLNLLAAMAEFERETIKERMAAGREYAKKHGTKSGNPLHRPRRPIDWGEVRKLRRMGASWRFISRYVGMSVAQLIKRAREEAPDVYNIRAEGR